MNDVEAVKSRVNIVDIVSEKVTLKRSSANYFGLCPFHTEKSPSFSVNEVIQRYKCFGCGESGDVFNFIMKTENLEFGEALKELADKIGYTLTQTKQTSKDLERATKIKKVLDINTKASQWFVQQLHIKGNEGEVYFKKRKLKDSLLPIFDIGYAPDSYDALTILLRQSGYKDQEIKEFGLAKIRESDSKLIDKFRNRLMFTIRDDRGNIVGFSGRFIGKEDPKYKPPKYLNSPETEVFKKNQLLFGLYQAKDEIKKLHFAIVTEGQMNILSSHGVGVGNIVASLGTSFTEQHIKLLSRYTKNIYLAFDKDNAGKKALVRTLAMIFKTDLSAKVVSWDPQYGKDPDELIMVNPEYWITAVNNPIDPIEYIYVEFTKKYDIHNIDHVNNFLKTVLELISNHKNDVKKDFYIKFLADRFSIPADSLRTMMNTHKVPHRGPDKKINDDKPKLKNDISTYDKIFALILQNWESMKHMLLSIDREYVPDTYRDLYDCLVLFTDTDDREYIRECVDDHVKPLYDTLLLMRIIADETISAEEHILKLFPAAYREFKVALMEELKKNPDNQELLDKIRLLTKNKI